MAKQTLKIFIITLTIFILHYLIIACTGLNIIAVPLNPSSPQLSYPPYRIVLIPLDSRPPCTDYVTQLAEMANITIILPPDELLDYHYRPANITALHLWLKDALQSADAAIISVDMLTYGSLLASRSAEINQESTEQALALIRSVHKYYPQKPIYAFNIIPRLLLADGKERSFYQPMIKEYSVLKDQVDIFANPADFKKMIQLTTAIPPNIIEKYNYRYEWNYQVNIQLLQLLQENIIQGLIIGQDDGQLFGIGNIYKEKIRHIIDTPEFSTKNVHITRGTDEVALTQLANLIMTQNKATTNFYVTYSDSQAASTIMPFMPHSVATTVQEKLSIANSILVQNPAEADIILYIHIANQNTSPQTLQTAGATIKKHIEQGASVAIVDLSTDFTYKNTLLPELIKQEVPLLELAAYAGWNTTSNSIGTAITQSVIIHKYTKNAEKLQQLSLLTKNSTFLIQRFLDDWYYQKKVQSIINQNLKAQNIDPYNLAENLTNVNNVVDLAMKQETKLLFNYLRTSSFTFPFPPTEKQDKFVITSLTSKTKLPWNRTFEIRIKPQIEIGKIIN